MTCNEIGERLLDLATGLPPESEVSDHLSACAACTEKLEGLRTTMSLLDEWEAPEPSPYFDTRLAARLREETAQPRHGWLDWFRRPALVVTMALLMIVGFGLFHATMYDSGTKTEATIAEPGTAVGDLQTLDKNHDVLANFDMLDELDGQPSSGTSQANP
jgi:predicted anti-sigma-YlaC factor YlaD